MPPKKKGANGYKFADPLPRGIVLEDIAKKRWKLGSSIGKGGFGEIYSAQEESAKGDKYPYVVKIEPHSNGPLFVEINFYIRNGKSEDVENFKKERGLKTFGMPVYLGSGSHEYKGEKYRFLVMEKFSTDLYKLYIDNNKIFPTETVFKLGIQILDILEYIHQRGYIHADIKAANLLMGATKETQNKQVFLVDFGLATRFTMEKEFKPNPKKAHDGTIEYLSRDAHLGVPTRRGDLEILAYNLIQWLGCTLPWEGNLTNPKVVQKSKEDCMSSVPKMIRACFETKLAPKAIVEFLNYLKTLKFDTEPDYKKVRTIFTAGVKSEGASLGTTLQFASGKTPIKRHATPHPSLEREQNKKGKGSKYNENMDDEDKTPKLKKRSGKKIKDLEDFDDVEMVDVDDDEKTPVVNKVVKPKVARKKPTKQSARSKNTTIESPEINDVEMPSEHEHSDTEEKSPKRSQRGKKISPKRKAKTNVNSIKEVEMSSANGHEDSDTEEITSKRPQRVKKVPPKRKAKTNSGNDVEMPSESEHEAASDSEEVAVKKPHRGKKALVSKAKTKKNTVNDNSITDVEMPLSDEPDISDVEETAAKKPRRGKKAEPVKETLKTKALNRKKKQLEDSSDIEMASNTSDNEQDFVTQRRKQTVAKMLSKNTNLNRKISMSVENLAVLKKTSSSSRTLKKNQAISLEDLSNGDALAGYTDAMKEIFLKKMNNEKTKKRTKQSKTNPPPSAPSNDDMTGFNAEMKAIAHKMKTKGGKKAVPIATTSKANSKRGLVITASKRLKEKPPVTHGDVLGFEDDSSDIE